MDFIFFEGRIEKKIFFRKPKYVFCCLFSAGGLTLGDEDLGEFITLLLATKVSSETFLQEFQCTFILGDTQQFHASSFVWSKTGDFTNNASDEFVVGGVALQKKIQRKHPLGRSEEVFVCFVSSGGLKK